MGIDTTTVGYLMGSVLGPTDIRHLFRVIAQQRIADAASLRANNADADRELKILEEADLIGASPNQTKYYVTAKGLKVARDLDSLPVG
jgi:hypothetical protein